MTNWHINHLHLFFRYWITYFPIFAPLHPHATVSWSCGSKRCSSFCWLKQILCVWGTLVCLTFAIGMKNKLHHLKYQGKKWDNVSELVSHRCSFCRWRLQWQRWREQERPLRRWRWWWWSCQWASLLSNTTDQSGQRQFSLNTDTKYVCLFFSFNLYRCLSGHNYYIFDSLCLSGFVLLNSEHTWPINLTLIDLYIDTPAIKLFHPLIF